MKTRLLTFILPLVCGGLLMGVPPTASSEHPKPEHPQAEAKKSALYGVLFYADWCPSCKVLEPRLDKVKPEFKDAGITFVRLDMTDDETKAASAQQAKKLGMEGIWKRYSGQTGFMLMVNGGQQVGDKLTQDSSEDELRQAMKQALAAARKPEHPKSKEHPGKSEHPGSEHPR